MRLKKYLHILTEDEKIRLQCEAHEMYEFHSQGQQHANELTTAFLIDDRLDGLRRVAKNPDYQNS